MKVVAGVQVHDVAVPIDLEPHDRKRELMLDRMVIPPKAVSQNGWASTWISASAKARL